MQPVRLPSRGRIKGALFAALIGGLVLVGVRSSHGAVAAAGLVVMVLALFLALGAYVSGQVLNRAVAAMRAGEHFGAWGGDGRPRVDVGSRVYVVDGEPRLYALHFERALAVEFDDEAGELRFVLSSNDGNGSVELVRTIPFAAQDREDALSAGRKLAAFHGVEPLR